jgi:hypothetical protein
MLFDVVWQRAAFAHARAWNESEHERSSSSYSLNSHMPPGHAGFRKTNMRTALYYLHITKTAGSSLTSFLDSQFDRDEICPAHLLLGLFSIPKHELPRYKLFRGHLWYGLNSYVGTDLTYMTMLRDPIERVISWYSHVRCQPGAYRHDRVLNENWTLLDFVTDEATNWDMINAQTLFLAVDLDYDRLARDPVGYGQAVVKAYARRRNDRKLLDIAKARLEKFAFVGLTERMQDSLRLLCHTFGFDPRFEEPRLNVSNNRPSVGELTVQTIAAIEEITELDRDLYDWAAKIFEERLAKITDPLAASHRVRYAQNVAAGWLAPLPEVERALLRMRPVSAPASAPAVSRFEATVNLVNDSCFSVSGRLPYPINLSYHWLNAGTGEVAVFDGDRTPLAPPLEPGESVDKRVSVRAPHQPGKYLLRVTLVQEAVAWFDHQPTGVSADFGVDVA